MKSRVDSGFRPADNEELDEGDLIHTVIGTRVARNGSTMRLECLPPDVGTGSAGTGEQARRPRKDGTKVSPVVEIPGTGKACHKPLTSAKLICAYV